MYILSDIESRVREKVYEKEPSAIIYLYGSRARNTHRKESDWDFLILLDKDKITYDIEHEITDPLYNIEIEKGEVISPIIYSKKEWFSKYAITPFFHSVMKEGRKL